ncbi:CobW family GTP-binding protein [Bordetella sp. 02P26C-1]|uniref:CobW family GTP-binding protein n=1 Tax=Bordetella sp. 02P26C-1 TaxID=2683195 RepID=UPI00135530D9|nr:GTP-binding protein [Bordetella sp. 02P26C-1]MVW77989.1 GTP-binding protein [Bordetella sp. 02P26C-1]
MTPVTLLTGFLGSGKTTLLSRLLSSDDFRDTAVIVNEFGEVSLDHEMIRSADETVITLGNGCLCCRSSSDVARALDDLRRRREAGEVAFQRVIIETSGLADPVPLLHALSSDLVSAMNFVLSRVVTVIDGVAGLSTLEGYEEARRQVGMADIVLVSKTDLADDTTSVRALVSALNPTALVMDARSWSGQTPERVEPRARPAAAPALHTHGYRSISLVREKPLSAAVVPLFLEGLATHLGDKLLRLKGFIALAECPDKPMVVHAVQHMVFSPQWLPQWPSDDQRTRIVLIGHDLPTDWPELLLEALEAEVQVVTQERLNPTQQAI